MTLLGHGMFDVLEPVWIPPLPQSVTSLTFGPDTIPTESVKIRDVEVDISTLKDHGDLLLSGPLAWVGWRTLLGIETILRGKFGGQLRLFGEHVVGGVVDMLLEIPSGLHFTRLEVCSLRESLLPTVRLAEACSETLVRLSYRISFHRKCPHLPPFSRSRNTDAETLLPM